MQVEENKVYCMDCGELFKQLPDNSIDLIITDPPYGIQYVNHFTRNRHNPLQGDEGIDYDWLAGECYRVLKDNAHAYFFTRFDKYPLHYYSLINAGFIVKNCLVIEKGTLGGIGDLSGSYANNSEWVIFCHKGRRKFEKTQLVKRLKKPKEGYRFRLDSCWFGSAYPKSTYNSVWQKKNGIYHPTIKSVECVEWLIQLSSKQGDFILDPYLGTGTTAVAALRSKRRFIGCEIDSSYYEIAVRRINEERNTR